MKSMFVLAATAMVLTTASSAFAAEQHVPVRGRTVAAIHADIVAAATSVCHEELAGYDKDAMSYCIRDLTRDAVRRVGSANLAAYDKAAFRPSGLLKASL
ncbi:hypothetical protein ASD79_03400 [Caulobacter sp. Root655]|uniref:hypothetical protein n=1 Tax=Caulobacter sp. Root655 TaxID=1736578 RepID=UPI0006FF48F2|nr:hypothetical protein [Caulobacter sp. Root655]KRA66334.1 hypothetical protein ASD79_03400 [Caulobacter sp. Root655]